MSAEEELVEEEVSLRNGGWSAELRKMSLGKGVKIAVQEFSRGSGNMIYRGKQGMQGSQTEREEIRQLQRMKVMKDMTRKI